MFKFFITLLFNLLLATQLYANTIKCVVCNKNIRGEYTVLNGQACCSKKCVNKLLPKCSVCHKSASKWTVFNNAIFCSQKCLDKVLPKCASCNSPCRESYITYKDNIYCSEGCVDQARPHCMLCNIALRDEYYTTFTADGDFYYCTQCQTNICNACTKPTRSYTKLPDGRIQCTDKECLKSLVTTKEEAERIFTSVRIKLAKEFGYKLDHDIPVHLVSLDKLEDISDNASLHTHGLIRNYANKKGEVVSSEIYLVSGYPKEDLADTCAHELAHDDMARRYQYIKELKIVEGYAEYIAYCYNSLYRREYLNRRKVHNIDPIYGDGFREIKNLAENYGEDALERFLKNLNDNCNR